jgi:hypothetical protein
MNKFLDSDCGENKSTFLVKYASYLSNGIYDRKFNDKSCLYMLTENWIELKTSKFISARRTHRFREDGFDQFEVETKEHYLNIRVATGLILVSKTERQLQLPYTPLVTIGVFFPPKHDIIYGVANFRELMGMMAISVGDMELNWS